jgi:putative ATPase
MDLFDRANSTHEGRPLADRMRPGTLDEFVGQEEILGPGKTLRKSIEGDRLFSMLFWGPPGAGKTTLARIIARISKSKFEHFSAVTAGVKEIRELVRIAAQDLKYTSTRTILFLDEIHRFNKSQQDYLLPHVESGSILLIGATTENPSFEVNPALRSRLRIFVFKQLTQDSLITITQRALNDPERGLGELGLGISESALHFIASLAGGDARAALNMLEVAGRDAAQSGATTIELDLVKESVQKRDLIYDKAGEEHYNIISALHKSIRDSDPDAGLYWMGRMLEAGEDPLYIARRLIRAASEDVGLASPRALEQSIAAYQACHFIGPPECYTALSQAVVFLATAPKSNALYTAYKAVAKEIEETGHPPVPLHLRNAPTRLMKGLGYSKGYQYAHDHPDAITDQEHFPEGLSNRSFYRPFERGFEATIKERMNEVRKKRSSK